MRPLRGAVALVAVIVGIVLALFRVGHNRASTTITTTASAAESNIHLVVLCSTKPALDTADLARRFEARWKRALSVRSAPDLAEKAETAYRCVVDGETLRLGISPAPLPRDLTQLVAETPATKLKPADIKAIRAHRGYVRIDWLEGSPPGRRRVDAAARMLLTIADTPAVIVATNVTAETVLPSRLLAEFRPATLSEPLELLMLFTTVHQVTDKAEVWTHTHGMEQFGLPDVETTERGVAPKQSKGYELVLNAAAYMVDRGPILKVGDTAEVAGDGVNYRIRGPSKRPDNSPGAYGGIELVREPGSGR